MLIDDGLTPEQHFREHVTAYGGLGKTLTERIAANMVLARKAGSPHMRRYYVAVARLQNRMIVNDRRALRNMAQGRELPPRPARKPYVGKRPGERSSPAPLTPLVVAIAEPKPAREQPVLEPTPWPDGEPSQISLFGGMA